MSETRESTQSVVVRKINGAPETVGVAGSGTPHAVVVYTMSTARILAVRILRVWLQSFLGLLTVDGLGLVDLAPPGEAFAQMWTVAGIALAPAAVALLQNLLEFLTKLDVKTPGIHA